MSRAPSTAVLSRARSGGAWLLWPSDRARPPARWFDTAALRSSVPVRTGGRGRGHTLYFDVDGRTLVLRPYRRGGMAQRLGDRYLRLGLRRSRAWRELELLVRLRRQGLPVPAPVGARVEPTGPFSPFARQLLLTEFLPGTCTVAEVLRERALSADRWREIGRTVARMHAAGVDHADLNAHNILLDDAGGVHLIDFDRGRLRPGSGRWAARNLARLRRSLDKLASQDPGLSFAESDWEALERGYRNAGSEADSASR